MSELIAAVDWSMSEFDPWVITTGGNWCEAGSAVKAMSIAETVYAGGPLRWECAGPHTFHGHAKDPEPAYESELP